MEIIVGELVSFRFINKAGFLQLVEQSKRKSNDSYDLLQAIVEDQKTFLPINLGDSIFTVYDVQNVIYKVR